jgi:L-malate glycosyltransferase
VLVIAPSLEHAGGQSVQAARLVESLRGEPGVHVSFLPSDTPLRGPLKMLGSVRFARTAARMPFYLSTLLRAIPRHDVIHVFAASYWSFVLGPTPAVAVARALRKQVVLNYHSGEAPDHLANWPSARRTLRSADAVVVQSHYLEEAFARAGLRTTVIPNHVDLRQFPYRTRTPLRPRFLSTRALEPHYGGATILRAFALVQRRLPAAQLLVVGDGSCRAELEGLAQELKLQGVTFLGEVDPRRMPAHYDSADVLLNASHVDSMPLSILEAYASGLPVVSTRAGGIPWLVTHEQTGLLVPVGDHEALAAAALRLLEDDTLAAALAAKAHAASTAYSWDANREAWLAVYNGSAS